jgi:hypothetical protein
VADIINEGEMKERKKERKKKKKGTLLNEKFQCYCYFENQPMGCRHSIHCPACRLVRSLMIVQHQATVGNLGK